MRDDYARDPGLRTRTILRRYRAIGFVDDPKDRFLDVPELRTQIVASMHDALVRGHLGVWKNAHVCCAGVILARYDPGCPCLGSHV